MAKKKTSLVDVFSDGIDKLLDALDRVVDAVDSGRALPGQEEPGGPQKKGGLAQLGAITGAITGVIAGFQSIIDKTRGFVEALSPGTILAFDQTLENLQATIGYAFEPIFQTLTEAFQHVAGLILPVMEQLRPIVQQISELFADQLITSVKLVVAIFDALVPIIQQVALVAETIYAVVKPVITLITILFQFIGALLQVLKIFDVLTPVLKVIAAVFESLGRFLEVVSTVFKVLLDALVKFIGGLFGFDLTDTMETLNRITREVIKSFLILTATALKFFGRDDLIRKIATALGPQKGGLVAAARSPALKSFEQVSNDLALAAAIASGRAGKAKPKFDLGDVIAEMKAIANGTAKGYEDVIDILETIKDIVDAIKSVLAVNPIEAGKAAFDQAFGGGINAIKRLLG